MKDVFFDHEKLDVYQLLLRFLSWSSLLSQEVKTRSASRSREVRDHLDRASLSALLNTAEGNGKRQQQIRAKFFDDARGSATECASCLDALVALGLCDPVRLQEGKEILVRIVQMLSKLIERYSDNMTVRENRGEYRTPDNDFDDDQDNN